MSDYIGPHQREIIKAMQGGALLTMRDGRWMLNGRAENRERCMGLYTRGFLMEDGLGVDGWRYRLTSKGERA